MTSLLEGWESDFDGTRWLFRYKATGMVQYHFPQPGDEYAEFLFDAGTGPIQLSPEERLALEQQSMQKGTSGLDHDAKNGTETSGSKREKKRNEVEGEYAMSANGYFDPTYFPGVSPLEEDDEDTVELDSQPVRSPVGYVAELATQETVKCAEELAPVELDGTSATPAPIQTNIAQELAELPTHRTPTEETSPDPKLTQATTQLVDPSAVSSASFAYSTTKPNVQSTHGIPSRPSSIKRKPVSSGTNPVGPEQNKFQPWKPAQGVTEQPSQAYNTSGEALPQTSILQNQNSELGIIGRKNSENESPVPGSIPNALTPPSAPNKPAPVEPSATDSEASSVPAILQPAQRPVEELAPPEINSQHLVPGAQATHNGASVSAADPSLLCAPTVLKPCSKKQDTSEGSDGPSEHVVQDSFSHDDKPSVTKINSFPNVSDHGTTTSPEESSKPVFPPHPSGSGWINSQSHTSVDEPMAVVAPLSFVRRHSSKSSQVSSIMAETPQSSKPVLTPPDDISDVISIVSSFTSQTIPSSQPSQHPAHIALGGTNKLRPNSISEGAIGRPDAVPSARPQSISGQSPPLLVMNTQQSSMGLPASKPTPLSAANIIQPIPAAAAGTQATVISPPSNVGTATMQVRPNIQHTHTPPRPVQGMPIQNQNPSPSPPHQIGNPGQVLMSPAPPGPQGMPSNTVSAPSLGSSQASIVSLTNQAHQPGLQTNHIDNTAQRPPQTPQVNMSTSNVNGAINIPVAAPVLQTAYQPPGQTNTSINSVPGSSIVGNFQATTQRPNFQHPASRPSAGYQVSGSMAAQASSQPPYQHYSPVTQSVSPIQSQVSSPAQSIASLHISQASTPSNTFATINTVPSSNGGANLSINQTTAAPVRPSSVPAHVPTQQAGNAILPVNSHSVPVSVAGPPNGQPFSATNSPAKPYPMLPGQVTPLPSQIGPAPVPSAMPQPANNNYPKPTFNTQQTTVGQQPTHAVPGQMNPMPNLPQGNMVYGSPSSQAQMKPPQQPVPQPSVTHAGGHQPLTNPPHHQPQQTASLPSLPSSQTYNPQTPAFPSTGSLPMGGQNTFPPPPTAQVTTPPGKPFTSTQAGAALTDAGKGMKKWAKKMFQNPAVKQTTVAISGAFLADSMGINPSAGAQLANTVYANATRPPLTHAQTAPPQPVQMGQQHQPVTIQPPPPQQQQQPQPAHPNQQQPGHLNQPHPLHPNQYQPAHTTQPQPGRPNQQSVHPNQQQPGHLNQPHPANQNQPPQGPSQPSVPQSSYPQPGFSHVGRPQPAYSQPVQQPAGAQAFGRPPVQVQNPAMQAGIAVNMNTQAQAQASFYQQQKYPSMNPVMMNIPPPPPPPPVVYPGAPPNQANGQANIDPATANALATMIGTAIGTATRPDHSQAQNAPTHSQGHGQQDYSSHSENHPGAHEHAAQTPATYTDHNYMATDTAYVDNSNYSVNNTYVDNTDVVNNTVIIDNSTTVVADTTTYDNTNYADATSFNNTDVTNTTIDVEVNSAVYTDGNVTAFSMDETVSMVSTSDVAAVSVDYSGDSWGDFSF